jgi:cytochrome o ubiquinol oxidase subunit 3
MNHHHAAAERSIFGFWVYLMTDLVMFATLFATYAVLHKATFGDPGAAELFKLPNVLVGTIFLLTSSFTCGMAMLAAREKKVNQVLAWFGVTFLLGAGFLGLEIAEFRELIAEGYGPDRNAFLSAFFSLVGTHGIHIAIGLLWIGVILVLIKMRGLTDHLMSRLERLALFWHFLDIVWIFIFSTVYLLGHVV